MNEISIPAIVPIASAGNLTNLVSERAWFEHLLRCQPHLARLVFQSGARRNRGPHGSQWHGQIHAVEKHRRFGPSPQWTN